MDKLVHLTTDENYAIIKIANGKVNAISHEVIDELNECLDTAEKEERVVIITGQSGIFSGGFDLKVMTKSQDAAKELVIKGSKLSYRLLSFPTPVILACNGHAVAKGAFLLLSADYRIGTAGEFKIGLNEVMIGMTMHNAGVEIARGKLTPVYFQRSVSNAEMYNPEEAVTAGFLDIVVPEGSLIGTAIKVAGLFGKLNKNAHKNTKLKVRKILLERLAEAIKEDSEQELSFNS
ncbi:enoyl-CoA hydratase [Tenacibaculum sp. SZ-18]|uniref:crotonase/enoyl-CoA hydratase family protein n=1 Tax=Tenacibaculum sp. SZ-18 TaxID=754423 RepID=UPI000C2D3B6E|nr:crotonase/enoyl-CoA hydratase family protein [Tenacibaculum sp. SZ-18]AUC16123.1 enoyl-CoA hydratase [Tenacibaculum sp. SZ-18]